MQARTTNVGIIISILLIGLVLRINFISQHIVPSGDEGQFLNLVKNRLEGYGHQLDFKNFDSNLSLPIKHFDSGNSILYPAIVSLVAKRMGINLLAGQIVTLFSAIISILLTYFIAQNLFNNSWVSYLSMFIMAVDYNQIFRMSTLVDEEPLFQVLFLLLCAVITTKRIKFNHKFATIVLLASLLMYARPNGIWIVIPVIFHLYFNVANLKSRIVYIALFLLCTTVLYLPLEIYKWKQTGKFLGQQRTYLSSSFSGNDGIKNEKHISPIRKWYRGFQKITLSFLRFSYINYLFLLLSIITLLILKEYGTYSFFYATFLTWTVLLSLTGGRWTLPAFYLLFFNPVIYIFGSYSIYKLYDFTKNKKHFKNYELAIISAVLMFLIMFPNFEKIRNRVNPVLKKKYDETATYNEYDSICNWISQNSESSDIIMSESSLNYFYYKYDRPTVGIPKTMEEIIKLSKKINVKYFVVHVDNLKSKLYIYRRKFMDNYWETKNGVITEKNKPNPFRNIYSSQHCIIYKIETNSKATGI